MPSIFLLSHFQPSKTICTAKWRPFSLLQLPQAKWRLAWLLLSYSLGKRKPLILILPATSNGNLMSLWFILFLPLAAFVLISFWTYRHPKLSAWIAFSSMAAGLLFVMRLYFLHAAPHGIHSFETSVDWIVLPGLRFQ